MFSSGDNPDPYLRSASNAAHYRNIQQEQKAAMQSELNRGKLMTDLITQKQKQRMQEQLNHTCVGFYSYAGDLDSARNRSPLVPPQVSH